MLNILRIFNVKGVTLFITFIMLHCNMAHKKVIKLFRIMREGFQIILLGFLACLVVSPTFRDYTMVIGILIYKKIKGES